MKVFKALGNVFAIVLVSFSESVFGVVFSFCANNQNFVFSSQACPGGIMFKSPVTINETCYCFPSDVAIYSSCHSVLEEHRPVLIPHSVTTCSRSPGVSNQEVQLLIPLNTKSPSTNYNYCPFIPSSCESKPHNQALKQPFLLPNDNAEAEVVIESRSPNLKHTETMQTPDSTTDVTGSVTDAKYSTTDSYTEVHTETETIPTPDPTTDVTGSVSDARSKYPTTVSTTEVSTDQASFKKFDESEHKVQSSIIANSISRISDEDKSDDKIFSTEDKHPSVKRKLEAPDELLSFAEMFAEQDSSSLERKMNIYKRMPEVDDEDDDGDDDAQSEDQDPEQNFLLRALADQLTAEMVEGPSYNAESKGASLLKVTSEIFKVLAPSDIIDDETIDEVFHTFVSTHLFGNSDVDDSNNYITDEMFHQVMNGLLLCQDVEEGFTEYIFESDSSCPPTIQNFVNTKTRKAISVDELRGKLPTSFSYVPEAENFVVGLMWKMVEAIHAACFGTWMNFDGSIPIFYWSFLEHFFLQDDVIGLFENESSGTSRYEGIIEAGKPLLNITFNVDTLVAAIHSKSQFPNFFPKPTLKETTSEGLESEETLDVSDSSEDRITDSNEDFIRIKLMQRSRRKRSVVDLDLKAFEIWDGQAYCLQQLDVNQPPSIENTFPLLPQVCQLHN